VWVVCLPVVVISRCQSTRNTKCYSLPQFVCCPDFLSLVVLSPFQCIAAGSHIANHEVESAELRPFTVHLSKVVTKLRQALRLHSIAGKEGYSQKVSDCDGVCPVYPEQESESKCDL